MNEQTNPTDPGNIKDADLTAYALGELEPGREKHSAVEAAIAANPQLKQDVEAIRALGSKLGESYAAAETGLSTEQRQQVTASAGARSTAPLNSPSRFRFLPYAAVAACAAGAAAVGMLIFNPPEPTGGDSVADTTPTTEPAAANDPQTGEEAPPEQEDTPPKPTGLDRIVSVDYQRVALSEVIADLREKAETNLIVNWSALELVGIDQDTLVSVTVSDVLIAQALDLVLELVSAEQFDDDKAGFQMSDNIVRVSTVRDLKTNTETQVYDIRHLLAYNSVKYQLADELGAFKRRSSGGSGGGLFSDGGDSGSGGLFGDDSGRIRHGGFAFGGQSAGEERRRARVQTTGVYDIRDLNVDVPDFTNAPNFDLNDALSNTNSGGSNQPRAGGGGGGLFGDDSVEAAEESLTRMELIDSYTQLIEDSVGDPNEWLDQESTLREVNGMLIVKTRPENHREIQKLLAQLQPKDAPEREAEVEQLAALLANDIEQNMIAVERRREQREAERQWRERFATITDNPFHPTSNQPLSTFSVDVDTASYTIARRAILQDDRVPMPDSVRIEEWINYFSYDYAAPEVDLDMLDDGLVTTAALAKIEAADQSFRPFATDIEVTESPWAEGHQLVRIGIKGMEVSREDRPAAHLVFLLDVSGSMTSPDKLPLVQSALPMLLEQLGEGDKISIVVYAGASGAVLDGVDATDKQKIRDAINSLRAGGSTAGAEGIQLAYELASKHYIPGGINRVLLCTDGDFNVGTSNTGELVKLVQDKANPPLPDAPAGDDNEDAEPAVREAIYLSVMGFGTGNLNDEMMEKITNAGNGNYMYIDSVQEAAKVLSQQASGTLVTIAKDVKLQVEFNPAQVAAYRLIGYENRILQDQDFNNDTVDAGDIGSGHTVTALYEIVPVPKPAGEEKPEDQTQPEIDPLRYQKPASLTDKAELEELLTLKLRYKPVDAAAEQGTSRLITHHVPAEVVPFSEASGNTRFAASVAATGMILRGSPYKGTADMSWIIDTAKAAKENDPNGYRAQFILMAEKLDGLLEDGRF